MQGCIAFVKQTLECRGIPGIQGNFPAIRILSPLSLAITTHDMLIQVLLSLTILVNNPSGNHFFKSSK